MICCASKTVFKALHRGGKMECADKTQFLPLYPVYRIMHSIPGSSAARLSNLMSSCSKWNVSGRCQDESFCLLAPRFDQMAAKILIMHVDFFGGRRWIPWTTALKQMLHQAINVLFEPGALHFTCSQCSGTESQGESEVSLPGDVAVFVGGERYKPLFRELIPAKSLHHLYLHV